MGFEDRSYRDHPSRAWRDGGGSSFGGGFFSWSFPIFTVPDRIPAIGGIRVRVHILYLLMLASELPKSFGNGGLGWQYALAVTCTLFLLVLLHEFGHCLACRWVGGHADDILMWPLGGLAACSPPHHWRPALITTIGGPGVNVLLVPILAAAMYLAGATSNNLLFNPLNSQSTSQHVFFSWNIAHLWLSAAYAMNLSLLAFNVLLPMFPMDGGRVFQELLWIRLGYKRSMQIAVNVGFVGAIALGMYGWNTEQMRLVGIAIFGAMTCYNQKQILQCTPDEPAWAYDTSRGYKAFVTEPKPRLSFSERRKFNAARRQNAVDLRTQDEVDRILDKVREGGMQSLSAKDRKFLEAETAKRQSI